MKPDRVREAVKDTPHMTFRQARVITSFMHAHDVRDVLELGFRFGVSTSYIAASLHEEGRGHITAIDLELVEDAVPGLAYFTEQLGLSEWITAYYEPTSYNWRLMTMLAEDPNPRFDLCYIDGAHEWSVDGFAFFLADRLLRPGGWMIFDDVDWTLGQSPTMKDTERVRSLPIAERDTPQVRKIVELLVAPHPSYGPISVHRDWAFAQKLPAAPPPSPSTITDELPAGAESRLKSAVHVLRDRL